MTSHGTRESPATPAVAKCRQRPRSPRFINRADILSRPRLRSDIRILRDRGQPFVPSDEIFSEAIKICDGHRNVKSYAFFHPYTLIPERAS